ncbi:hypothetical protein D3C85_319770 [compost metagenome]
MSTFIPAALPSMDCVNLVRDQGGAVIAWRRGMSIGFMGFPPDATLVVDWISDDASRIDFIDRASELMSVHLDDEDRESIQTAGQLLDLLERRANA